VTVSRILNLSEKIFVNKMDYQNIMQGLDFNRFLFNLVTASYNMIITNVLE